MSDLQPVRIALDQLLPQTINIVVSIDEAGDLYSEEQACIVHASESRQKEFKAGRMAAKQALAQLDIDRFPLLKGEQGEPLWPEGVVGSISHSDDVCIVSVAHADRLKSLGVDIQKRRSLKEGIERMICTQAELSLDWNEGKDTALLILFAAKEAAYKALYPRVKKHIGFKDVTTEFEADNQYSITFESVEVNGRYAVVGDLVLAACF